jgi:nucleotide-binding universal stress UspA family protein
VIDEAKESAVDLIVVTSHRPQMSTYLLGSNAAKIVRHATCSVLVLRG